MKVDIKDIQDCQKLLKIQVESQRILDEYQNVLKEFSKSASVPGFRQGKAPVDLIKIHYDSKVKEETLHRLIHESYHEALSSNKIEFIGYPKVDEIQFEIEEKPTLIFSVTVDIRPKIQLKPHKNIKLKKKKLLVEDEEIQKTLKALQEQNAKLVTVDGQPSKMGDYLVCDYKINIDDKQIDSKQNVLLLLDENSQLPHLVKNLAGCQKDTAQKIELILPKDYPKNEYRNKKSIWHIDIKQIKEKILPKIDDEFAKDIGNFKDLEELKNIIKDELTVAKKQKAELDIKQQIFDFLLKSTNFSLPPSLLKRQTERLVNDAKIKLLYQGLNKEQVESQQAALEEKLKPDAENQLKLFFILDRIADEENIDVSETDTANHIDSLAKSSKQTKEEILKYINDNDLMDDLKMQLRHEKTVEFLLKDAVVEEEG